MQDGWSQTALQIGALGNAPESLFLMLSRNVPREKRRLSDMPSVVAACKLLDSVCGKGELPVRIADIVEVVDELDSWNVLHVLACGRQIGHFDTQTRAQAAKMLIAAAADVNACCYLPPVPQPQDAPQKRGSTPLQLALRAASIDRAQPVLDQLLQHVTPAQLAIRDQDGCTLLHRAASCGQIAAVSLFLKVGRVVGRVDNLMNAVDNKGSTPLHAAVRCDDSKWQSDIATALASAAEETGAFDVSVIDSLHVHSD